MIINLTGTIDEKMMDRFILDLKEIALSEKQVMQVMINSEGGDLMIADAIKNIIESLQLPLVAYKQISSAALYLFMTCNTEREILKNTFGVYHKSTIIAPLSEDGQIKKHVRSTLKSIFDADMCMELQEEWMGMTKAERKLVHEEDGDLGLNTERLNKMLEKSVLHNIKPEEALNTIEQVVGTGITVVKAVEDDIKKIKKALNIK